MTDSPETEPTADRPDPIVSEPTSASVPSPGEPMTAPNAELSTPTAPSAAVPAAEPAQGWAPVPSFGEDTATSSAFATSSPEAAAPTGTQPQSTTRGSLPVAATIAIAALVGGAAGAGVVGTAWMLNGGAAQSSSASQNVTINNTESVTAVSAVAAKALPSVVTINASDGQSAGTGSGVIISTDGYIVTNTHVVTLDGATASPTITVITSDGNQYSAKLIGTDPNSDLAVVKIDATGLTAIEFADSSALNVGQTTIAIGAPMELSNTVTQGIISALYRGIEIQSSAPNSSSSNDGGSSGDSPFEFWNYNGQQQGSTSTSAATISLSVIQTDAAINPGNSGGALLDANAKLIGINVAILSNSSSSSGTAGSIGIGFAIPSNQVQRVAEEIIANGNATHGLLGATVTSTAADAATRGALVKEVTAGGPAASAGVVAGDVITQFNGVRVNDQVDLTAMVRAQAAGSDATVTVVRNGQAQTLTVKLGSYGS